MRNGRDRCIRASECIELVAAEGEECSRADHE
jgi:hypothetical protein